MRAYFSRLFVIVALTLLVSAFAAGQQISGIVISPNPMAAGAIATARVNLTQQAAAGGLTISISSDSSFATVPATVVVPAGVNHATFSVTAGLVTATQTVNIKGTDPTGKSATGAVTVNVPAVRLIGFSVAPNPCTAGSSATASVTLSANTPVGGMLVKLASTDPSVTLPATVTVPAGAATATCAVATRAIPTNLVSTLSGTDPVGYTASAALKVTIPAVRLKSITFSPTTVTAPGTTTGTVVLNALAPADFVVNLVCDQTFASVPAAVTVKSGSKEATFSVATSLVATNYSAVIIGKDVAGYEASGTLTVKAPPVRVTGMNLSPKTVAAPGTSTGTVTLSANAPAGDFLVNLASSQTFASVPATVKVLSGTRTATFTIATTVLESGGTATISATDSAGYSATAELSVTVPAIRLKTITVSPVSVTSPTSATGKVTLTAVAPTGGFTVNLASDKASATVPPTVTVKTGAKSINFQITTHPAPANETAVISGVDANSFVASANFTVNIPAVRLTGLDIAPASVTASNSATGTLTLADIAPAGGFTVNLTTAQSFIKVPSSVAVPAGSKTATFTILTTPVTAAGTATVNASDANGYTASATITVKVPTVRLMSLSIAPVTVTAGTSVTGTVTLSALAPTGGMVVNLATMNTFINVPMNVTVAAGSKKATFSVTTSSVTASSTATVTGSDTNGYSTAGSFRVTPAVANNTISMTSQLTFSPKSLTVAAGTTVIWTNDDHLMGHSIKPDLAISGLDSDVQYPSTVPFGKTFSWTVPANAAPGTVYYYHCKLHGSAGNGKAFGPGMAGVIVVK